MRTAVLLLALAVAGCKSAVPELEAAAKARRAERDRLTQIAENLDEHKKRVQDAQDILEKSRIWRADGDAGAALKTVGEASESPVGFTKLGDGRSRFTLGGRGGADGMARALQRLAGVAPGFQFVSAQCEASGSWTILVETRDAWQPPLTLRDATVKPRPLPENVRGAKARRLVSEIEKLEREIAELERLVGEVKTFEKRLEVAEYERQRAKAPDSAGGVSPWVTEVMGPVLGSGTVTSEGGRLRAKGPMAKGVDVKKLATLAPGKYEIVSVAPPNAEIARR